PILEADGRTNRRPMVVSWKSNMRFEGQHVEEGGKKATGYAHFLSGVVATMDEARMVGEELDVFLNQPISLAGAPQSGKDGEEKPKIEVSYVHVQRDVEITNRKLDPTTGALMEFHRINGIDVDYQLPGRFEVRGPGLVRIYGRNGANQANPMVPAPA